MKKILAALLVVVMVVSLFPATVFAAAGAEECAVVKEYGTHSKAYADKLGVKYVQYGKTVAPECGQDGYTMYECACGVYFADDIIDMPDHEHADGAKPVSARVEPTCSEYGKAAFYVCKHCDKQYPEYETEEEKNAAAKLEGAPAGAIAKLEHTFASDSFVGNDCTAETQKCSVCGEVVKNENPKKEHNFNYSDPHAVTKHPGTCTPGEATFVCQTEGCDVKDTVIVDEYGHDKADLTHKNKKAAKDCATTGTKEHWICEECGTKFIENEDGELVIATDADLVIAVEHQNVYAMDYRLPSCELDGFITYKCRDCGAKPWTVDFPAAQKHTTKDEAVALQKAYEADKTGEAVNPNYTKATVECVGTTHYWDCQNPIFTSEEVYEAYKEMNILEGLTLDSLCAKNLANNDQLEQKEASDHTKYTVKIPAAYHPSYAAGYSYTYTLVFCTNENCSTKAAGALEGWQWVNEEDDDDAYYLNVSVLNKDGDVYEMTDEEKAKYTYVGVESIKKVELKQAANCKSTAHYYRYDAAQNQPATCSANGTYVYNCYNEKCLATTTKVATKLAHVPDYENSLGKSDGYTCGKSTYLYCKVCKGKTSSSKVSATHKPDLEKGIKKTIEVPNCKQSAGDYYECLYCGVDYAYENVVKYAYQAVYTSVEAAEAAHATGTLTLINNYAGDCETVGKKEFKCSACAKFFWVYDTTTGVHAAPDGTTYYEEANCLHGKGYVDYTCWRCGEDVKAEEALPHNLTKYEEVKATCTTDGNVEYYTCSNECCQYKTTDPETGKKVTKSFTYIKVETEEYDENNLLYTKVTYKQYLAGYEVAAKLGHDYENKGSAPVSCVTTGYTYFLCANEDCGADYVTNVVPATGHKKQAEKPVTIAATCEQDGKIYYVCANAWCTGDDGLKDTDAKAKVKDDKIYTDKDTTVTILPALGHINAAHETFYATCLDKATDRVCIRKDCDHVKNGYDKIEDGKLIIGKRHEEHTVTFPATCETPEYKLFTCKNGCGQINNIEYKGDALGHLFAWYERAGVEFVDAAEIKYIGEQYLNNPKDFNNGYKYLVDKAIIAYTPATYDAEGSITYTCADCGKVITQAVKNVGIDFTFELDNVIAPGKNDILDVNNEVVGFNMFDGDIISVDVELNACNTNVWGFNFDMRYNAYALKFLGYDFHIDDQFANYSVTHETEDYWYGEDRNGDGKKEMVEFSEDYYGYFRIAAFTEDAKDGTMVDVKLNGTKKVVTLYFQVQACYDWVEEGRDYKYFADEAYISLYNTSAVEAKLDEKGNQKKIATAGMSEWFDIFRMVDANMDYAQSVADIQKALIVANGNYKDTYLASADVNKDGKVTLTDAQLIQKLFAGKTAETEIYNTVVWTAPEGFVAA